jgi:hypothetical protein
VRLNDVEGGLPTGVGIARELQPKICDMFMQGDVSLERSRAGLGVGLTLVRNLVALHGGTVDVHSDGEGTGSEFTVSLPIDPKAQAPRAASDPVSDAPSVKTPSTAAPFVPDTTKLRVLGHAAQECRGCDLYKYATQAGSGLDHNPRDRRSLNSRETVVIGATSDRAARELLALVARSAASAPQMWRVDGYWVPRLRPRLSPMSPGSLPVPVERRSSTFCPLLPSFPPASAPTLSSGPCCFLPETVF